MSRPKGVILLLAASFSLTALAYARSAADPVDNGTESFWPKIELLVAHHEYARVEQIVGQHLANGANAAKTYFQVGKIYFEHEAWQRSADFLEKSLKLEGKNEEGHRLLGLDWRELHRPDDAEKALIEAATENPANGVNAYFAGQQLLLNGKFEAALPYLYGALQWRALRSRALNALALTQARLGNYGLAESYCRKAIDSTETSAEDRYAALLNLSTLLLLGHDSAKLEEALRCAEAAKKLQPNSHEAQFLAGKALFKLGRLEEARVSLTRAAKLNPEDRKVHFLLAKVYEQLGQPDRARDERKAFARIQGPERTGMATRGPVPTTIEDLPDNLHR